MTTYKIDYNRGADANDGITAPWKNLSKLSTLVATNGDNILLASDSIFDILDAIVITAGWTGTREAPITIGKYDPSGVNTGKPIIRRRKAILAGDWTYDAPKNGWYFTWPFDPGWACYILLGGIYGINYDNPLPLPSDPLVWKNDTAGKVYVYAPAGTNPTNYYGSVYFAAMYRNSFAFIDTGNFVILQDIDSIDGGGLVSIYSDTGNRNHILRRCDHRNTGPGLYQIANSAGKSFTEVRDSNFSGGISVYVNTYSGDGLGFGGLQVSGNKFYDGCAGNSQGQVYTQASGGFSIVRDNYFEGARYGTPYHQQDGVGMYAELGSDEVYVLGNHFKNTYVAATDNTGRDTYWIGNLFENCYQAMKCEDENLVGSTNHRFWQNTIVGAGNPTPQPGGGVAAGGIGWRCFNNFALNIRNNVFIPHVSAPNEPAIECGTASTGAVVNNAHYGFTTFIAAYTGAASPVTPTGTITANPLLDSDYSPLAGSPLLNAGIKLTIPTKSFGGKWIEKNPPDIGAFQQRIVRSAIAR